MHILYSLFGFGHVSYSPILVSKILSNSLENKKDGIKSDRLDGLCMSFEEAKTTRTMGGQLSKQRIVNGLDDSGSFLLAGWKTFARSI